LPYVSVPPIERAHPRRHHGKHPQKMCECSVQLHSSRQGEILQRPLRGHSRQNGNCLQMWPHKLRGRRVAADFVRADPINQLIWADCLVRQCLAQAASSPRPGEFPAQPRLRGAGCSGPRP
jgi:hypothetical protein